MRVKSKVSLASAVSALVGSAAGVLGQGTWQPLQPMPSALQQLGAATLAGRVYAVGGFDANQQVVNTVYRYDPLRDTWQTVTGLPAAPAISHVAAVALAGKLYILGGLRQDGTAVDTVHIYTAQTGQWTTGRFMLNPRGAAAAAVIDGRIYLAGGSPPARGSDFSVYDPLTNRWTRLPNMQTFRGHLAGAAYGGKFYAIGGRRLHVLYDHVEEYDPVAGTWRFRTPMPTARADAAAAVVNRRIYVFGGEENANHPMGLFTEVEEYRPDTDTWRGLDPMPTPRHGHGAAVFQGRVYLPGGATERGFAPTNHNAVFAPPALCDADCDTSTGVGILDILDFLCFQNAFDAGDPFACNFDAGTGPSVCDVFDFLVFQNAFSAGCP